MILFETTESVVELLWDVALAFFIVRLALIYFLLNFTSAALLSYLAFSNHTPITQLVTLPSHQVLIPFLLVSAAVWARVLVVRYEIPRSAWFRLAIGGVALALMVLVEGILGVVIYEWEGGIWEKVMGVGGGMWGMVGWLGWYGLMPWAEMGFEKREVERVEEMEETKVEKK